MARMVSMMLFVACFAGAHAAGLATAEQQDMTANPIRKVVSLLQGIAKKIESEGESSQKLYDKYMCYCKKQRVVSAAALAGSTGKDPQTVSSIKESQEKIKQLKLEISTAKKDASEAAASIESAKEGRAKVYKFYVSTKAELESNVASITSAIDALKKGKSSSFLQGKLTEATKTRLLNAVEGGESVSEGEKEDVAAFISNSEMAPGGDQVVGILSVIKEDYEKNLVNMESAEVESAKLIDELVAAKTQQGKTLAAQIETKIAESGQLEVNIVRMKREIVVAEAEKAANEKFAEELETSCNTRVAENDKAVKARGEEVLALSDTIKMLNDDDALDLLKKALPSASSSLLQIQAGMTQQRNRALAIIRAMPRHSFAPQIDFLSMSLSGKKVSFGKVVKMIDEMVVLMKEKAAADIARVEYCNKQIDSAQGKAKGLKRKLAGEKLKIGEQDEIVAASGAGIAEAGEIIQSLDAATAQAGTQRKAENAAYVEETSTDSLAKELLSKAKARLNAFYNPSMGKGSASLVQISEHDQLSSRQALRGVVSLLDKLITGLGKELLEAKLQDENSQKDYERLLADSATKRATYVKTISEKEGSKAEAETSRVNFKEAMDTEGAELMAVAEYEMNLHQECDWMIANKDLIAKSRDAEAEQLRQAKDVLSGANLSFLQGGASNLRGGNALRVGCHGMACR